MVLQVRGRKLDSVPSSLTEFFESNPEVGVANELLAAMEHTFMWRDQVLFIHQRQQATSDYRENKKVRWIGSHAALTCHIALMRHTLTGVASIGHFDNFCCWQFGEDSSAHTDGIEIMLQEIEYLSGDIGIDDGLVEVTVVGGYEDERGDAAKNSLSLLKALHNHKSRLELRHFCVGSYNTQEAGDGSIKMGPHLRLGRKTAIIKGLALDLKSQLMFPAIFDWCQFSDFDTQIKDRMRLRMGEVPLDTEEANKTADSTFKPKSLRNKAKEKQKLDNREQQEKKRRNIFDPEWTLYKEIKLRSTGINENARRKNKTNRVNFRELENEL